jgi:hypothetical protein
MAVSIINATNIDSRMPHFEPNGHRVKHYTRVKERGTILCGEGVMAE